MQREQLEAFLAVVRIGTVTGAAEELYLAQSSLSARLHALEAELGGHLFRRGRRGIVLTEAGRTFLPFAQAALEVMEEGARRVDSVRRGHPVALDIAAHPTISTYLLPPIVKTLAMAHPEVEVRIHSGSYDQIRDWIIEGRIPIGLMRRVAHPELRAQPVHVDELVLVASPIHPFARSSRVTLQELAYTGLIMYDRNSTYYELTQSLFRRKQLVPRFSYEINNIEATKRMVCLNLGVAIAPLIAVAEDLRTGRLARVEIVDVEPIRRLIYLIQRADASPDTIVKQFLLAAESHLKPVDDCLDRVIHSEGFGE